MQPLAVGNKDTRRRIAGLKKRMQAKGPRTGNQASRSKPTQLWMPIASGETYVEFLLLTVDKLFPADHCMAGCWQHTRFGLLILVQQFTALQMCADSLKQMKKMPLWLVADGSSMGVATIGNIKGMIVNKCGQHVGKAMLTDVTYLPHGWFNLFSVTKLQKEGWKLSGDEESIWLQKNGMAMSH